MGSITLYVNDEEREEFKEKFEELAEHFNKSRSSFLIDIINRMHRDLIEHNQILQEIEFKRAFSEEEAEELFLETLDKFSNDLTRTLQFLRNYEFLNEEELLKRLQRQGKIRTNKETSTACAVSKNDLNMMMRNKNKRRIQIIHSYLNRSLEIEDNEARRDYLNRTLSNLFTRANQARRFRQDGYLQMLLNGVRQDSDYENGIVEFFEEELTNFFERKIN